MELSRRLRGRQVIAVGAHPGLAPTDIAKNHRVTNRRTPFGRWFTKKMEQWIPTIAEAVEPILHGAHADDVRSGEYYGPGGWLEFSGAPARARINARAADEAGASQLWSASEIATGVSYLSATTTPKPVDASTHPTLRRP
jgi:hypothetical protein